MFNAHPCSPIHKTDPFDCSRPCGMCHLKWIIKDNRDLLRFLDNARCSSSSALNGANAGKLFSELDPNDSSFNDCAACPAPVYPSGLNPSPAQHVVCDGEATAGQRFNDPSSVYHYYECDDMGGYYLNVISSNLHHQLYT